MAPDNPNSTEKTEVLVGTENAARVFLQYFEKADKIDACAGPNAPIAAMQVQMYRKLYTDFKESGRKMRFVTEINKDNLADCKELMKRAEVRHLDGIRGNFAISDKEYIAISSIDEIKPIPQMIYSNAREIVDQHQYLFDALWSKTIPAEQKIVEIEQGIAPPRTEVIHGLERSMPRILDFWNNAMGAVNVAGDPSWPVLATEYDQFRKIVADAHARNIRLRVITEVTKDNMSQCKKVMQYCELYHSEGIKSNLAVSDSEYLAWANVSDLQDVSLVSSNERKVVEQQTYLFETLLSKAIPAEQKIKEIEEGVEPEFFEVINDGDKVSRLLLSLSRPAKKEILLHLTNDKSLVRMKRLGLVDQLKEVASRGSNVRIICPITEVNSEIVEQAEAESRIEFSNGDESQFGVMIVDSARFIGFEMNHPDAEKFAEATGIAIHSNSRRTVDMLRSFFESLWRQTQLYEQLESANKKLEVHDMMQKEFINVASHELKTPITPILVSLYLAKRVKSDDGSQQIVLTSEQAEMIERNAKRLERLATEILEVARIEVRGVDLHRERIDLNERITEAVSDAKSFVPPDKKIEFSIEPTNEPMTVDADRGRLSQVLANLIKNAIRFIDDHGKITIAAKKSDGVATISVSDTGTGIDPEIVPRLFQKFTSSSGLGGTGLGLFISKAIVEAHGGKIWAEDKNGKGATFAFTLPLAKS